MRSHVLSLSIAASLLCGFDARAQTPPGASTRPSAVQLLRPMTPPPSSASLVVLPPVNDNCAAAINVIGLGTFPFDNSTATGSPQGQLEPLCLAFGSTSMKNDVWFTWTAPSTGVCTFATCGLTGVDTKIAAYPGAGCPANNTALACNDDSCASFQSSIDFPVTAGAQYTLQIGTYPTATGGVGDFSLTIPAPPGPPVPASVYVDIGSPNSISGVPSNAYAAASGTPGFWNARSPTVANGNLLNDLAGNPCEVVLTRAGTQLVDFEFINGAVTGEDAKLMNDAQDVGGTGGTCTWTFSNLYGGNYAVYTYAWAPDSAAYISDVSVAGAVEGVQTVGGAWPGSQVLGTTYALHHVNAVPLGGSIAITVSTNTSFATLNGFQIVDLGGGAGVPTPMCFGDGSGTACPCGNASNVGDDVGCLSSLAVGGKLRSTGNASIGSDTLVLQGSQMPNSSALYFQGSAASGGGAGIVFGDGLRCAGGTVIRLGTKLNAGGASQYPTVGDPAVSVRGLDTAGDSRVYQCWYRNAAAFCTASTFNLTNGVSLTWNP